MLKIIASMLYTQYTFSKLNNTKCLSLDIKHLYLLDFYTQATVLLLFSGYVRENDNNNSCQ